MPFDPWHIPNPEPGVSYQWANGSDQMSMAEALTGVNGRTVTWQFVQGKTRKETLEIADKLGKIPAENWVQADGRIKYGQNVLMQIPTEELELRHREMIAEQRALRGAPLEAFKAQIDEIPGARPVIQQQGETKDRAAHAAREGRPFVSTATSA